MKTLLLLRHAKSSWGDPALDDHDRPLNGRGKRDAPRMGKLARKQGVVPDLVLCSTAKRARSTAKRFLEAARFGGDLVREEALYESSPRDIVRVLRAARGDRVMVVAHNPGLESLIAGLTGEHATMPTAALAVLRLGIADWPGLALDGSAALVSVWRPREIE